MENPHDAEQAVILERIIKNVDKCNEAILEMNHSIREIVATAEIPYTASLFENYSRNVAYNLENVTKTMPQPK